VVLTGRTGCYDWWYRMFSSYLVSWHQSSASKKSAHKKCKYGLVKTRLVRAMLVAKEYSYQCLQIEYKLGNSV
jgi:hypothetical protein